MSGSSLRILFSFPSQRREKFTSKVNTQKKLKKFFSVALTIFFASVNSTFAQEASIIPSQFGTILDSYQLENVSLGAVHFHSPLIIHIQDAHESYRVQRNIASLINVLVRDYNFKHVFEEGNSGVLDTSQAFWFSKKEFCKVLANQLLREGKISGPEFAQITNPQSFQLHGAEDATLYASNIRVRQQLAFYKIDIQNQLRQLERELKKEALTTFSKDLRRYRKQSENFWKGLAAPPFELELEENAWDLSFFRKLQDLDRLQRDSLIKNSEQKELLEKLDLLGILRKMSGLNVTREDLEKYQKGSAAIQNLIHDSLILQEFFAKATQFYQLAEQRDLALIQSTLEGMIAANSDRAVLVSGGFHTKGISKFLRDHGISYMVVAPVSSNISLLHRSGRVAANTLREPNLFNLPMDDTRLFVDLRAMGLVVKNEDPDFYLELERDARHLNRRRVPYERLDKRAIPDGTIRRDAVFILSLNQPPSNFVMEDLFRWVVSMLKASPIDFIVTISSQSEKRSVQDFIQEHVSEKSLKQRIQAVRLLTPQDFGSLRRALHGKFTFFVGVLAEKKRLELSGLIFDQVFPFSPSIRSSTQEKLFRELETLQKNYKSVFISA